MKTVEVATSGPEDKRFVLSDGIGLIGWLTLCFTATATGIFVSTEDWYAELSKPSWNPPAWIFGPVWTVLYIMMAVAAWLVWREGGWPQQWRALSLFVLQWLLNAIWTPLFFGLHLPGVAFVEMIALWVALVATIIAFWRVRVVAAILLIPYWMWVSFAAFLNFTIWRLNP
jgi:tryptophan-rich sensory protein